MATENNTTSNIDAIQKGWFSEINSQWPGQAMSLEIEEILFNEKSQYQHIIVFKSKTWGNVLILDGVIQLTERDEMAYQEMIAHLPLFSHPNPENVLIIGGGDGGVIREVLKHPQVKSVVICEIDQMVIDCGKKYFPTVASAWDDSRVTLHCGDGAVFMKQPENIAKYDVIITDSSDPVGPAQTLFESPFYMAMHNALKPGGKVCTQAESIWINLDLISKLVKDSMQIYANVEYATTQIPTYPAGQIGFLLCSKASDKAKRGRAKLPSCVTPRKIPRNIEDKFRFYTSELHSAAFVLPAFVTKAIQNAKKEAEEAKGKDDKMETADAESEESAAKKQKVEPDTAA